MREILLYGGPDDSLERSVPLARRLADSFGARLHVVSAVEDAGWTSEMGAERLPELHQAFEEEARERLSRSIPPEEQERLGVIIAVRVGAPEREIPRYTEEHAIDLAVLYLPVGAAAGGGVARALLDGGRCAVLVLR